MMNQILGPVICALSSAVLLVEVNILRAMHCDPPYVFRLFALQGRMGRMAIEGKIEKENPYFKVIYRNLNVLLRDWHGPRDLMGLDTAEGGDHAEGVEREQSTKDSVGLLPLPRSVPPAFLEPIMEEIRGELLQITRFRIDIELVMGSHWRQLRGRRKARAKAFLKLMSARQPGKARACGSSEAGIIESGYPP